MPPALLHLREGRGRTGGAPGARCPRRAGGNTRSLSRGQSFRQRLLERERDRQLLAEALDSKYADERRRKNLARGLVLTVLIGAGYYATRGAMFVAATVKPIELGRRPDPGILAQMKKQMAEGDPLVIGGDSGKKPEKLRSRGDADDFQQEKVPFNLYPDIRRQKKPPVRQEYGAAGPREKAELEALAARAAKRAPFDYGKYRPAVADDLRKLPPARPPGAPKTAALYAQVPAPPPALAPDEHEFPPK